MAGTEKRIKKANRKATKGIKKAWKKGQSSSYNPAFNKFRLEARKRAVFGNRGEGNLTEAKLAQHNKLSSEKQCDDVDAMSIGGDTAISAFTNCSLPTFSRLIKNWSSGSLLHKEMIAVLAAVTDVLKKTDGGNGTETEYFATLMITLDAVDTDEGITAVVCLLSMVVKRLNENVLKLQCDTSCDVFIKLLLKYMNSDYGALLRNLLKIVYTFLKVKSTWSDSTREKFEVLLEFTVHHKPKVRRTAHQIVRSLLVDTTAYSAVRHPGATVTANFCVSKLENSSGPEANKEVFYVLSLLEETLGVLPQSSIKLLCETIIHVMTLSNSIVTSGCLKTLRGLFEMKPSAENLPSDLNARIITALYDYQPNVKESHSLVKWIQLMEAAIINLRNLDEKLCICHLPKFFDVAIKCWQSEKEVLEVVASTLKNILRKCINPSGEVFQQCLLEDPINNPMHKMFHFVEQSLNFQYHQAWGYVLTVISACFEIMGKHCYTVMLKCLQSLADMHDSYKFSHIVLLEKVIGTAIQHMGPRIVLQAIPLQINADSNKLDFPRSWLLPLLRDNTRKTELQFFISYFMPLAARLKNKMLALQQEQKVVESKLFDLICSQIWSLLPGFCNEPTDLVESFKNIAQTLGILLDKEPALRLTILSSLRVLISKNLEDAENRAVLACFAKNYLPILFNLYSTEGKDKNEEKVRLAVFETCKAYLQIADKEHCKTYFGKAFEKLLSSESSIFMQQSLIDICRAILPYVDVSEINRIFEHCKPLLKDPNHTTQKKAYSVMNEICSCESKSCKSFVKEHLEDMRPMLCGSVSGLKPSTRALRLNILGQITKQLSEKEKDFITSIVPEAVLCTKENSIKARAAAYDLLIVIGNIMIGWQPSDHKGALYEYMKILLAGLAGSPHLMSASILAIGRVLFEFKDKMDSNLIHLLIENTCLLLTSKSREVVVSSISLLKILFSVMDTSDLAQHVEYMVKSITSISEDNQRHFRFKAKELFTKLIRKFGYEMISKLVPASYQKQITNIRKIEARKARKKATEVDDSDSELPNEFKAFDGFDALLADSDDEMPLAIDSEKKTKASRKKNRNADPMIEEHGEDDIVDFLDPAVNRRLLTVKPETTSPVKKTEKGFPVSEDGRLIITEEDEPKQEQLAERNEILAELKAFKSKKKRKFKESDDEDDEIQQSGKTSVAKGIHRSLGESQAKKRVPGSEFKAKKAGGDIKKGKVDPYAYVPLNRQLLNKRKQVKMKGQFKNIVKGAKKGALSGLKRKSREAKRRKNKKF